MTQVFLVQFNFENIFKAKAHSKEKNEDFTAFDFSVLYNHVKKTDFCPKFVQAWGSIPYFFKQRWLY